MMTRKELEELLGGEYCYIRTMGPEHAYLDGRFTPEQLRAIADTFEQVAWDDLVENISLLDPGHAANPKGEANYYDKGYSEAITEVVKRLVEYRKVSR